MYSMIARTSRFPIGDTVLGPIGVTRSYFESIGKYSFLLKDVGSIKVHGSNLMKLIYLSGTILLIDCVDAMISVCITSKAIRLDDIIKIGYKSKIL